MTYLLPVPAGIHFWSAWMRLGLPLLCWTQLAQNRPRRDKHIVDNCGVLLLPPWCRKEDKLLSQKDNSDRFEWYNPSRHVLMRLTQSYSKHIVGRFTADTILSLYSLSGRTFYCRISWSHEAVRLDVMMIVSFWYLTEISVALLPMCLSNFKATWKV